MNEIQSQDKLDFDSNILSDLIEEERQEKLELENEVDK